MYALQRLLWDVRKDPALAARFRADPNVVLDEYRLFADEGVGVVGASVPV